MLVDFVPAVVVAVAGPAAGLAAESVIVDFGYPVEFDFQ